MNQPLSLIAFDLDSTLIREEGIDEFARRHGVFEEVAKITEEAMQGDLPFEESFVRRVALLKGLRESELLEVVEKIQITPGARELIQELKKRNYKIAILSGGFHLIGDRVAAELGIDFVFANRLEIRDGLVTGKVLPPIVDGKGKAERLRKIATQLSIPLARTAAVGDGANDILMLETAGNSFSFNGKPKLQAVARHHLTGDSLYPILALLTPLTQD